MKVITWNCNMAFRKKADFILAEQPDILIVPECENMERLEFGLFTRQPTDSFWYGDLPTKGIGIFTYGDFKIKLLDIHNPDYKYVIPLLIYNDKISLAVCAVWSQKPANSDNYPEQVWNALHYYTDIFNFENIIIAGDFNSNTVFDKAYRIDNHSNLVEYLRGKNIVSTYHHFHNQNHGKEKDSTFYMYRKKDQPAHIDFCFASSNLIDKLLNVEIGKYEVWTKHSDHKPLIVTFNI